MTTPHGRLARLGLPTLVWALTTTGVAGAAPFTRVQEAPKTLSSSALEIAQRHQTLGKTSTYQKTLTFTQKTIRVIVVTGPENDMLSYRIHGLRNPTLVIPKGAVLKILFVNTDDDMFHDLRIGAPQKTYPNRMESELKLSVGTPPLPHGTETVRHGDELTLRAPKTSGRYAYYCTVRGHAQGGMVGTIIVR